MCAYLDGKYDDAETAFTQVMETRKRVLGQEHPDTLTSMANLASTYRNQGRWKEAEQLEVQVMETRKRVLGQEHPDTLTSIDNLASTYQNQGRWKEAYKWRKDNFAERSVTFKSPSPSSGPSRGPTTLTPGSRVDFTPPPHPDGNGSDEDSDDGLFAIPLTNKSLSSGGLQNTEDKASRPTLSVDTEPRAKIGRCVTFKSPSTSSGPSSGPTTQTPEVDIPRSIADTGRSNSAAGYSSSAQSPDERMGRRHSFVSEIWANRPPVENVVNHLDEFFPGVDLDQPYLEESATSPISSTDQNPMDAIPSSLRNRITYGTDGLPLTLSKNEADTLGSDESTLKAKDRDTIANVTNVTQRQIRRKKMVDLAE